MPKALTNSQRKYVYSVLVKAEGEYCFFCYTDKGRRKGPPKTELQIDHADNNRFNWDWKNVHLLCRSCNCTFRSRDHSRLFRAYSDSLEREREREGLTTWKTVFSGTITVEEGSPELRLNRRYKPLWMAYIVKKLKDNGGQYPKKRLLSAAAKAAGCSAQASENYMRVESSDHEDAPFDEYQDDMGNLMIRFREPALTNPFERTRAQSNGHNGHGGGLEETEIIVGGKG